MTVSGSEQVMHFKLELTKSCRVMRVLAMETTGLGNVEALSRSKKPVFYWSLR
jgi:hypothetical protein